MARQAQNNQSLQGTWTIAQAQTYFTLAFWGYREGNGYDVRVGAQNSANDRTQLAHASDDSIYNIVANGGGGVSYVAKSGASGWNHYAMVFDGSLTGNSNRLKSYFNGTQQTLTFISSVGTQTSNAAVNQDFSINSTPFASIFGDGQYAEIGAWQAALTAADIASLSKGFAARRVRPDKLKMYLPLVREIIDQYGHITLTNTNTAISGHPRIY